MQFEQLSLYDSPMPPITYRQLDNDGKVYCKIDWLTVMFFDCSLNDVLRWLKLENCVSDFCLGAYEQSRGYDQVFKFIYNGILLETSSFNFYGQDLNVSIFDTVVPKIRLELSGGALDYLRSCGIDMDSYRLVGPKLPDGGSYHFTRCDFAYDFINYRPDFVDRLIDHINKHKLPSERVPLASTKGAIGVRVVTGGQKTVYLGSAQSDRMLRVYDKKMQNVDLATGLYKRTNPYGDPESWFRIEWQTRNRFANNLVHGVDQNGCPADFKSILKDIFDRYAFADGSIDARAKARPCVDFWLDLFNWEDLERRIIQNAKYVESRTPEQRLLDAFDRSMDMFMRAISYYGIDFLVDRCNSRLIKLQTDPSYQRSYLLFLNKLNELPDLQLSTDTNKSDGLLNVCGRLFFNIRRSQ